MSKQRELMNFLVLNQKIENSELALSECRKEITKIAGEKLKLKRALNNPVLSNEEVEQFTKARNELSARREELIAIRKAYKEEQQLMISEMTEIYKRLINIYNAWISQFEFDQILKRKCSTKWKLQKIQSWSGCKVGWAYVNEKDKNFNKPIYVETSIVENSVEIENSDTLKVAFVTILDDPEMVEERWDWFDYYLYSVSGFYTDKKLMEYYADFLERDREFAEFVTATIHEDLFTDPIFGTDLYDEELKRLEKESQPEQ